MNYFLRFAVLLAVLLVVVSGIASFATETEVRDVKVVRSERVCSSSDDCRYLIFTDKGVFSNTDNIFRGKFNSSDMFGEIHQGSTYDFKVIGYRIPFLSQYQNVIEQTLVP